MATAGYATLCLKQLGQSATLADRPSSPPAIVGSQPVAATSARPLSSAHSLLVAIYHTLRDGTVFQDLSPTHFEKLNREAVTRRSLRRLEQLGYRVTLEEATALPEANLQGKTLPGAGVASDRDLVLGHHVLQRNLVVLQHVNLFRTVVPL